MAIITSSRNQFVVAEGHCKRALDYSRRFNGPPKDKTESVFQALKASCALQTQQGTNEDYYYICRFHVFLCMSKSRSVCFTYVDNRFCNISR
jgi:hypothetical protein